MSKKIRPFREILADYRHDEDIMSSEPLLVASLKEIVQKKLPQEDRNIIYLYAELGSLRELGEKMHLSHTTVRKEVARIRKKIFRELKNYDIH